MFDETFIDHFSITNPSPRLVNFATGVMVTEVSKASLLNVPVEGKAMLQKILDDRFVVPEGESRPRKSFYDPLSKSKVAAVKFGNQK